MSQSCDVAIVGGGWFGCVIADFLKRRGHRDVVLLERDAALMRRASYNNQARVHNGYHYPRSFQTAYRSRVSFQRFVGEYHDSIVSNFTKLYCIASQLSKVTPLQFERFCRLVGAPCVPARKQFRSLFNADTIAAVYEVQEFAFNSNVLAELMRHTLAASQVELRLNTGVERAEADGALTRLLLSNGSELSARVVFNCTYSALKQVPGLGEHCSGSLKYELTEMALVAPPDGLKDIGVTVMDGPFFSCMPFPSRGLHTLSHVRYTPHTSWVDGEPWPQQAMGTLQPGLWQSRGEQMLLDSSRYMPGLRNSVQRDTLFEVKTVLRRNEVDDGRPILMERSTGPQTIFSVLGGKMDNVYDVLERLEAEGF